MAKDQIHTKAEHLSYRIGFLEVPVLARYYLPARGNAELSILAGPQVGMRVRSRARDWNGVMKNVDLDNELSHLSTGLTIGGGADRYLGKHEISVEARYTFGMNRVFDLAAKPDIRTRDLEFMIGFSL